MAAVNWFKDVSLVKWRIFLHINSIAKHRPRYGRSEK